MCRILQIFIVLTLVGAPAHPSGLQDSLKARWRGAWVIVAAEIYSNCDGTYTNNRVNGRLVSGKGAVRFPAGELAKVQKVDLKRSRIDIFLDIEEPLLLPYQDGPFELYNEARCQVELLIEIPREQVKGDDVVAIERSLMEVLERYVTSAEARESEAWNGRVRKSLPEGYEETLAEHRVWKAEQLNRALQARIDDAIVEASKALSAVQHNSDFSHGFTSGIARMQSAVRGSCEQLLRSSIHDFLQRPQGPRTYEYEGLLAGQHLAYHVELARRLRGCFV